MYPCNLTLLHETRRDGLYPRAVRPEASDRREWLLAANLDAAVFDFVACQKVHGQTLNLFIIEQLPVVPPERYQAVRFGPKTAAEVVREAVLELTYTAHDMAPFAVAIGHVDGNGQVLPPFRWDDERRLNLRAKLDALYFHRTASRAGTTFATSTQRSPLPNVKKKPPAPTAPVTVPRVVGALTAGHPDAN